ncbi:hypothetical protein ACFL5O_06515 [Myxococcota bacterium]
MSNRRTDKVKRPSNSLQLCLMLSLGLSGGCSGGGNDGPTDSAANKASDGPSPANGLPSEARSTGYRLTEDSFSFPNFSGQNANSSLTANSVARMFGEEAVCASVEGGNCRPSLLAGTWLTRINQSMAGGRCEGFAVLSGLFFLGVMDPADFGASSPFELDISGNPELGGEIAYWFSTQFLQSVSKDLTRVLTAEEAVAFLGEQIAQSGSQEMFRLGIVRVAADGTAMGGHAVMAYEVRPGDSEGEYLIGIYDNNHPGEERAVVVDVNANRWEYQASSNPHEEVSLYMGDPNNGNKMYVTPITPRTGEQPCLFCVGTDSEGQEVLSQLFTFGTVEVAAVDGDGNETGVVGGRFVNQIEGATLAPNFSVAPWVDAVPPTLFLPPASANFKVRGEEGNQPMHVTLLGRGYSAGMEGGPVPPGETDQLSVSPDGLDVQYIPSGGVSRGVSVFTVLRNENGSETRIALSLPEGAEATLVALNVDPATGNATVRTEGTVGILCQVKVTRSTPNGQDELENELYLPAGGMAAINLQQWGGEGEPLELGIDIDGDGVADSSVGLDGAVTPEPLPWVILDAGDAAPTAPDGASLCPPGDCNFQTQAGCDEGHACAAVLADNKALSSCELPGQASEGEPCQDQPECAKGLACAGGRCRRLCCGNDWSVCPTGQSCFRSLILQRDDTEVSTGAGVCYPVGECNILDPDACGEGRSCRIVSSRGDVACSQSGTTGTGEACNSPNDCQAQHVCAGGQCYELCLAQEAAETPPCSGDNQVCVHYQSHPAGVGQCMTW